MLRYEYVEVVTDDDDDDEWRMMDDDDDEWRMMDDDGDECRERAGNGDEVVSDGWMVYDRSSVWQVHVVEVWTSWSLHVLLY